MALRQKGCWRQQEEPCHCPLAESQLWAFQSLASQTRGTTDAVYRDKTDPRSRNPTPSLAGSPICLLSHSESIEWGLSYCVHGCCKNWRVISVKHQSPVASPFS